jgi:fatty acid desaturase
LTQEPFDDVLDTDALIAPELLSELRVRTDAPSLRRLVAHTLALVLAVGLVVVVDGTWWAVPATVLLAALLASVFAPFHECTHQTAFATAWLNRLGALGTGTLAGLSAAGYRGFHLNHHRFTQDPTRDPEIAAEPATADWPTTWWRWLRMITHSGILLGKLKLMTAAWLRPGAIPQLPDVDTTRRTIAELRVAGTVWFGLLVAGLLGVDGALEIVAAFVLSHLFLGVWLPSEHTGRGFTGSILARTRTVETLAPVRYFLWNMNYHAEHHAWPAVPWHALPRVHGLVHSHVDAAPGYLALHREVFSGVVRGKLHTGR